MILTDTVIGFAAGFLTAVVLLVVAGLLLLRSLVRKALLGAQISNVRIMKVKRDDSDQDRNL